MGTLYDFEGPMGAIVVGERQAEELKRNPKYKYMGIHGEAPALFDRTKEITDAINACRTYKELEELMQSHGYANTWTPDTKLTHRKQTAIGLLKG